MNIFRSLLYTLFFLIFIEILSLWMLIGEAWNADFVGYPYIYFVNGLLELIGLILFMYFSKRFRFSDLKATKPYFYPLAMILGIGFFFLQIPLNVVFNLISGDEYQIALEFQWNGHFSLNTLGFVFFIPFAEELFFRQFLQKELAMKYPAWLSIVLSALLFALIHLGPLSIIAGGDLNWHSACISLFGGFIAASLFYFSKSIGPAILFHVFWNAAVALF